MKTESEKIFAFIEAQNKAQESVIKCHYPESSSNISLFDALENSLIPDDLLERYDFYMSILQKIADGEDVRQIENLSALLEIPQDKMLSLSEYDNDTKSFIDSLKKAQNAVKEFHYESNDVNASEKQPVSVYDALENVQIPNDLQENYAKYMHILQDIAEKKAPSQIKDLDFLLKLPKHKELCL